MWTGVRNARAAVWLDIGAEFAPMTAVTVAQVRALLADARRQDDGTQADPSLFSIADLIVRSAIAAVRAGRRGEMDAQARAAAARTEDLGAVLGIEIAPKYREIMSATVARPSPDEGPGWPIHKAVLAADPALSGYFATVDDWSALAAQLIGGGIETAHSLIGGGARYDGADQAAAHPPARGRWGAVRRWRLIGAGLLG